MVINFFPSALVLKDAKCRKTLDIAFLSRAEWKYNTIAPITRINYMKFICYASTPKEILLLLVSSSYCYAIEKSVKWKLRISSAATLKI